MKPLDHPLKDWEPESIAGLALAAILALAGLLLAGLVGLTIWTMTQPTPTQTTTHWVDQQGDVKRLCLAYKTGDHVDALSCDLIDPMTGKTLDQ